MNSPAHDLALYLSNRGVGQFASVSDWAINVASEPPSPDRVTTLYDVPGGVPDTCEVDVFVNSVQVRTRGDYPSAYEMQSRIRQLLIHPMPIECDTSTFTSIDCTIDVGSLGHDSNNRFILVATYRTRRTEKEA